MSKYHYPAGAADVIIEKDDKLLLIRRKNEPFKGLLAIPGGFVNEGEKVEDTAVRDDGRDEPHYRTNRHFRCIFRR
jgi:8-oxo-dGTP diphosphatase